MANQIPLPDDSAFWNRQMREHAMFLNMMLVDPTLKAQAGRLEELWARTIAANSDVMGPLNELLSFKQMVLARLKAGEWLGWALPSFVQHILMEGTYYRSRLTTGTSAAADFQTWLQIVKDHAAVGPKLIDPMANDYAAAAAPLANQIGNLQRTCAGGPSHQCLSLADQAFQTANTWVEGIPVGLNIVPAALKAHILRENSRGITSNRATMAAT